MSIRRPRRPRLFVTGGAGFLGGHVATSTAAGDWEIVAPSSRSLDLRNAESVLTAIREWKPHAIIHTAYRRDDRDTIVAATRHVAEAAGRTRTRLVHVSTDALFGGRPEPYTEDDPPDPVHDYGRHKADAEVAVMELAPDAVIVRTSLICGSGGRRLSVHEQAVRDAITGARPMTFFTDEFRSPVRADDLAAALVDLAARTDVSGILHIGGPTALSRAELALTIAEHHRWGTTGIQLGTLEASGLLRPANVVLDSTKARRLGIAVRGPVDWRSG